MTLAAFTATDLTHGSKLVLKRLFLTVAPNERIVLLGRSGVGKSTLLNALYDQMVAADLRVALVPQDHALVPQLSVLQNVLIGRLDDQSWISNLRSWIRPTRKQRTDVHAILTKLDLAGLIDSPVEVLSGGQKQRAALARALYRGGRALIADEPVSAIDETQAPRLMSVMQQQFETMIIALHDVGLARNCATRLIGLRDNAIFFDAPPAQVSDLQIQQLYSDV